MKATHEPHIDAGQATIIVDRCVPPAGDQLAPSAIKAVLWCIRGLGAPGTTLGVASGVVARRTCLSDRTVRRTIAFLCDTGVLEQVAKPAPGRTALYTVDYVRLSDWLADDDREQARIRPDAGRHGRRTPDDTAAERRTTRPPSPSTPAISSATPDDISITPDDTSPVSKEETALPADTCSSSSAAADEAGSSWEELDELARHSGIDSGISGQLAELLVARGAQSDHPDTLNALERFAEVLATGNVDNPPALFRSMLDKDGGVELSKAAVKRRRERERRESEFGVFLSSKTPEQAVSVSRALHELAERKRGPAFLRRIRADRRWSADLVREFAIDHWDTLKHAANQHRGAA